MTRPHSPSKLHRRRDAQCLRYHSRRRLLRFDILEDRRLMAGLDVLVFNDADSTRDYVGSQPGLSGRVVYVDFNANGSADSNEPLAISDETGHAIFGDLSPGSYLVRLLGNNHSVVQTTTTTPAQAGTWSSNAGVKKFVGWTTPELGWYVSDRGVTSIDVRSGQSVDTISYSGVIDALLAPNGKMFALSQVGSMSSLLQIDTIGKSVSIADGNVGKSNQLLQVGNNLYVRTGTELHRIYGDGPHENSWLYRNAEVSGIPLDAQVESFGNDSLMIAEAAELGTRVSVYRLKDEMLELSSERNFTEKVSYSSASSDGILVAMETPEGVLMISNASGLPTVAVLASSKGPTAFDAARHQFVTMSQTDGNEIDVWSSGDWKQVLTSRLPNNASTGSTLGLDFRFSLTGDSLVGSQAGSIYRHNWNVAQPASVSVDDSAVAQLSIGARTNSENIAPELTELPRYETVEDQPVIFNPNDFQSAAKDSDGDGLFFLIRSAASFGKLNWSVVTGGAYSPNLNSNGLDQFSIQAFDGRDWSALRSVLVNVKAENDAPTGIVIESDFKVPELSPGFVLGAIHVADPDLDSQYDFAVSDGRFAVINGNLQLSPSVALDFEGQSSVVLSITAWDRGSNDQIQRNVTVSVVDEDDPPLGIILTGTGQVPEKTPGFVVGNIVVLDPDRDEVYDIQVSDTRFEVTSGVVRLRPGVSVRYEDPGWIPLTFQAISRRSGLMIQRSDQLRVIKDQTPYHNDNEPTDVDGDGHVTPLDPLAIINHINRFGVGPVDPGGQGEGEPPGDLDVDGDGVITPLDILIVINQLNNRGGGGGSGENNNNNNNNNSGGEGPDDAQLASFVPASASTNAQASNPFASSLQNHTAVDMSLAGYFSSLNYEMGPTKLRRLS